MSTKIVEKSLKDRQIEVAQLLVDTISGIRPQHKGKKVADVDPTDMHNEIILRFNDWTTMKVVGSDAKHILAGKIPE